MVRKEREIRGQCDGKTKYLCGLTGNGVSETRTRRWTNIMTGVKRSESRAHFIVKKVLW